MQRNQILEAFDSEPASQQIYMITGVRGSGKTVLMTEVCEHYRSNEQWLVVELNPNGDLLQGLLAKLSNHAACISFLKEAKINLSFWGLGIEVAGAPPITDIETAIMKILLTLGKKGKKVLVAIDEATSTAQMQQFASAFQIMIRQNAPLYLLMTGLYENIDELQNEKNLTFLYRAPKIYLNGLNIGAVARKYKSIFSLDSESAAEMAKLTMGYPFAFQVLGYLTYNNDGAYKECKMKKLLAIMMCLLSLALVGCGDDKKKEEPKQEVKQEQQVDFQKAVEAAVHEVLEDAEIVSVKHEGTTLTIALDETKIKKQNGIELPLKDVQVSRVSAIGDKIVDVQGFDNAVKTVIVTFKDGKKVEMPTSIIKKNDYGMRYFPSDFIDKNLK